MNKFYMVLGDWSDDGHGKHDKILIKSNIKMKDLQKAYKESCKKTGVSFHDDHDIEESSRICVDYQDGCLPQGAYDKFLELKCPFENMDPDTEPEDGQSFEGMGLTSESFINLLMWFIGLSVPGEFKWKKVEDEIPCFNGYWQEDDMNFHMGYGLYE